MIRMVVKVFLENGEDIDLKEEGLESGSGGIAGIGANTGLYYIIGKERILYIRCDKKLE